MFSPEERTRAPGYNRCRVKRAIDEKHADKHQRQCDGDDFKLEIKLLPNDERQPEQKYAKAIPVACKQYDRERERKAKIELGARV
jgi:hypothetical protein